MCSIKVFKLKCTYNNRIIILFLLMEKSFKTSISEYDASFQMQGNILVISLKSVPKLTILFARYSQDNIPNALLNVIDSPDELYQLIHNMKSQDIGVENDRELVLSLQIGLKKKEFVLPLERTGIAKEEQLIQENEQLKQQIILLKIQNEKNQEEYKILFEQNEILKNDNSQLKDMVKDLKLENDNLRKRLDDKTNQEKKKNKIKQQSPGYNIKPKYQPGCNFCGKKCQFPFCCRQFNVCFQCKHKGFFKHSVNCPKISSEFK